MIDSPQRPATLWHTSVLIPSTPRFPEIVEVLVEEIDKLRTSTRGITATVLAKEIHAATWVIEGLYQAYFSLPRVAFALPRSERFYSNSKCHPMPFPLGAVKRIIDAARSLGWIRIHLGTYHLDGGHVTTVEAAGELATLFSYEHYGWAQFASPSDDRLILVADASPERVRRRVSPYESQQVAQWQYNLRQINELFLSSCICLDAPNDVILEAAGAYALNPAETRGHIGGPLNFSQVTLRRVFARGRLDHGGRFYGGWWQLVPSKFRKYVSINGDLSCEADYSGMALNCLYAMEGKNMGVEDAYDIGLSYSAPDDPRRKIVKKYINAVINDEKKSYRLPLEDQRLLGISASQLRDRVTQRHAPIAHHFHSGVGLHLQFIDSEIAEKVMLHFVRQQEVCLPIHDSFIVRSECIDLLVDVMEDSFRAKFGCPIKIRPDEIFIGERMGIPDPNHIPCGLTPTEQADALHANHWGRVSIGSNYYTSWVMQTKTHEQILMEYEQAVQTYLRIHPQIQEKTRGVLFP
jgi:hypothetical protein